MRAMKFPGSPAVLLLSVLACGGCDWTGSHVAGDYSLDGTDVHRYLVDDRHNRIVVEEQVLDAAARDGHVFVLRQVAQSYDCTVADGQKSIYTEYTPELQYWVFDVATDASSGPLDRRAYLDYLKTHGQPDLELDSGDYYVQPNSLYIRALIKACSKVEPI